MQVRPSRNPRWQKQCGWEDSPFRLRSNYAGPSGLYGHPASARRATARRGRKLNALLAALLFAASGAAQAKTINALSLSLSDVTKAVGSAVDGDGVIIPAGKATWTSNLVITKAITLMGQTTTDSAAGTAVDNTIIQAAFESVPVITFRTSSTPAGKIWRVTGITFQDANTGTVSGGQPYIWISGSSGAVRIDHCNFA